MNQSIQNRKAEILLRNRKNKIFEEYDKNKYCKVIDFSKDVVINLYSEYFKETIKTNNNLFTSKLQLDGLTSKNDIKNWILNNILIHTVDNNIISILYGEFGIKLELTSSEKFFSDELQKKIDSHIGLDYGYINENKYIMQIFSDEEHYVYEYLKKWDESNVSIR
ncbi:MULTISPECIES: hypothetical protein [unclassified Gilliamella]|uniref:hypothetical protein n=1 Tax=unclassified Gilliamella TaxID=2685620 RepID=UPI00130A9AAB|nr:MULTISPECIES: hypothetical protein [unclassified Gilliamella]MWP50453.1 hypothetical protein [Gilliamella sp. Lep-s35]MWP70184.1 hypothetical protein [Gilliamella sp. Lep-s5]MWP78400.1 hypothetical protein [Gilliamella sp. Lep-s21]